MPPRLCLPNCAAGHVGGAVRYAPGPQRGSAPGPPRGRVPWPIQRCAGSARALSLSRAADAPAVAAAADGILCATTASASKPSTAPRVPVASPYLVPLSRPPISSPYLVPQPRPPIASPRLCLVRVTAFASADSIVGG